MLQLYDLERECDGRAVSYGRPSDRTNPWWWPDRVGYRDNGPSFALTELRRAELMSYGTEYDAYIGPVMIDGSTRSPADSAFLAVCRTAEVRMLAPQALCGRTSSCRLRVSRLVPQKRQVGRPSFHHSAGPLPCRPRTNKRRPGPPASLDPASGRLVDSFKSSLARRFSERAYVRWFCFASTLPYQAKRLPDRPFTRECRWVVSKIAFLAKPCVRTGLDQSKHGLRCIGDQFPMPQSIALAYCSIGSRRVHDLRRTWRVRTPKASHFTIETLTLGVRTRRGKTCLDRLKESVASPTRLLTH